MPRINRYFQPYREKIAHMHQPHDPLDAITFDHPFRRSYDSPFKRSQEKYEFNHYYKDLSTTPTKKKLGPEIRSSNMNHNKTEKFIRMGRQFHEPVWDHLYYQGLESKRQILQQHENEKDKIDSECTFQPLIKKNFRYNMSGTSNFLERNSIWYENKIEKIVKQKEQEVNKDLQNCTFKPKINNKKLVKNKYHKGQHSNASKSLTKLTKSRYQPHFQYIKHRKGMNYANHEVKNLFHQELQQIQL